MNAPLSPMIKDIEERERERVVAFLRVERLRCQLWVAELDCVGTLVRDKLISPSTAIDWLENPGPIVEGECREVAA